MKKLVTDSWRCWFRKFIVPLWTIFLMNEYLHVFMELHCDRMGWYQSGQRLLQLWVNHLMNKQTFPYTDRLIHQIHTCLNFVPSTLINCGEYLFWSFSTLSYPLNANAYHTPSYSTFTQAISTHKCLWSISTNQSLPKALNLSKTCHFCNQFILLPYLGQASNLISE